MAFNNILFLMSVFLLFAFSTQAALKPVSYISSAPDGAPAQSPSSEPLDVMYEINKYIESNMITTKTKTEEHLKEMEKRATDPSISTSDLECLKQCQEVYESTINEMENTINYISSGNYYKAGIAMSEVASNVETCQECYNEKVGEIPEINKFDSWVLGINNDCLSKLEKYVS